MDGNLPSVPDRPSKVKIGTLDYTIEWKSAEWEMEEKAFGQCTTDRETIRISERLTGYRLASVFSHEVAHALAYHFNCYDKVDPEQACDIASYGMVMFWRDNPDAFIWWIDLIHYIDKCDRVVTVRAMDGNPERTINIDK